MKVRKNRSKFLTLIICLLFLLLVVGIVLKIEGLPALTILDKQDEPYTVEAASEINTDLSDMLLEAESASVENETETGTEETQEIITETYATSHKAQEPLTDNSIKLTDIYAAAGTTVHLQCYYPQAASYSWEKYDMQIKDWEALTAENVTDELYRAVSTVEITVPDNKDNAVMVRCTVKLENGEDITGTASVYPTAPIIGISADDEYVTGCGEWLPSREVPVNVTFDDGSTEKITGLDGLVFVDRIESSEITYSDTGNMIETVTTVNTECEYSYVGAEKKELLLRYRNKEKTYDTSLTIAGTDMTAPVISDVSLSDFAIKNVDEPVTVEVSITAEDNETPYPKLEYAFLPQGAEPQDTDWTTKTQFEKDIDQNGIWIAYCRDQGGNIAEFEKKIIAVDQKAPVVSLALEHTDWCQSNKILVDAKDELPVMYMFTCPETGEDSGWIDRNEYDVGRNGTWQVQVKDAVGNVAVHDITISNIDTQMPVIKGITETEGEQAHGN